MVLPPKIRKSWLKSLTDEGLRQAYAAAVACDDYLQFGKASRISPAVIKIRSEIERRNKKCQTSGGESIPH